MKLKAVMTENAPGELGEALEGRTFAQAFLDQVVAGAFGADNPIDRPAEFYVQNPDYTVSVEPDVYGVEVRLTGVSRGTREPKLFHDALAALEVLVIDTVTAALCEADDEDEETRVQVFVAIMLDGDIPGPPDSGPLPGTCTYSSILESEAVWVGIHGRES